MDTYTFLRAFADSWFLVAMFAFFVGVCAFAFWPSQRKAREDAAGIPLRDDPDGCPNNCAACACKSNFGKV